MKRVYDKRLRPSCAHDTGALVLFEELRYEEPVIHVVPGVRSVVVNVTVR
jgi:hypothetical protein